MKWKVNDTLRERRLTAYAVRKASGIGSNTMYRIKDGVPTQADFAVVEAIAKAIQELSGQPVLLTDLLELKP